MQNYTFVNKKLLVQEKNKKNYYAFMYIERSGSMSRGLKPKYKLNFPKYYSFLSNSVNI